MNMCEHYQELISRMLDDELNNQERKVLAEHLSVCSECAAMYSAFSMLSDLMESDMIEPPEELAEDVMAHIRRAEMRRRNQREQRAKRAAARQVRNLVAAAACVAVLVAAVGGVSVVKNLRRSNAVYESRKIESASGAASQGGLVDSTILAPTPTVVPTAVPVPTSAPVTQPAIPDNSNAGGLGGIIRSWWGANDGWFSTPEPTPVPTQSVPQIAPPGYGVEVTPAPYTSQPAQYSAEPFVVVPEAPAATETPAVTEPPVVNEAAVATEPPVASEIPVVTAPPIVPEAPAATETPAAIEPPVVDEAATVTEPPIANEIPVVTAPPVVTEAPVIEEAPIVEEAPAVPEMPLEEQVGFEQPDTFVDSFIPENSFMPEGMMTAPGMEMSFSAAPDAVQMEIGNTLAEASVSYDFSALDCTEFVNALFGLEDEAEGEAAVDAAVTEEDSEQYPGYIDKLITAEQLIPVTLPENIEPDRVESLSFTQDEMFFTVQVEFFGEQMFVLGFDAQGNQLCFMSDMSIEEYDAFVKDCLLLNELE